MSRWRKVIKRKEAPESWSLTLECGHEVYRSAQHTAGELPRQVLCHACDSLIGSHVKTPAGKMGRIEKYTDGNFVVAWPNDELTSSTLDELREDLEFVS